MARVVLAKAASRSGELRSLVAEMLGEVEGVVLVLAVSPEDLLEGWRLSSIQRLV